MGKNLYQKIFSRISEAEKLRFTYKTGSSLFKSWPFGLGWGHNRENHLYMSSYGKNL
jgi:hypothetical protein